MIQFIGSILDSLFIVGFGAFALFQPHKLASKEGTPEPVEKRVRLMKRAGAGLIIAGVGLFVVKRFNHALQRTRPSRSDCNPHVSWAGSLGR